jgi:hypothetical protein
MIEGDEHPLAREYRARGVPTEWEEITPPTFAEEFRLIYRALPSPDQKSGSYPGQDEAEELIHDPVKALRAAHLIGEQEFDESGQEILPRISTMVVNHEKTLNRFIMHAFVALSNNPRTIGITIVKEEWVETEGTEETGGTGEPD